MPDRTPTGDEIRDARLAAGLSQQHLAYILLDFTLAEVALAYKAHAMLKQLREWERGTVKPDTENTDRLLSVLEIER